MSIYAVTNHLPASGRTTTALSLASYLGAFGARVLLVDLDPRADTTAAVGRARTMALTHALAHGLPLAHCAAPSAIPRVDLFDATDERIDGLPNAEGHLRAALLTLAASYTYTLIDCPPEPRARQCAALGAARLAILPVPGDESAGGCLAGSLQTIEAARDGGNHRLAAALLLTMQPPSLPPPIERRSPPSLHAAIPFDERLDAVLDGQSVLDLRTPGAHAYERLAVELAAHAVGCEGRRAA